MILRQRIKEDEAFLFVVHSLEILSPVGERLLMAQPMLRDTSALQREWDRMAQVMPLLDRNENAAPLADLRHQLMQLHDIEETLLHLRSHQTVSEVELFEIKHFALIVATMRRALRDMGLQDTVAIGDLHEVFVLLDPDTTGIANFYIYDSYHPELGPLRKELRQLQNQDDPDDAQQQRIGELLHRHDLLQQEIIERLSAQLVPYAGPMLQVLEVAGYCDLLLAKSQQALDWQLCRPTIGDELAVEGLVHPQLQRHHLEHGLRYQPVDIRVTGGTTLITGANMAGKTVLLKALACCQLMAQYGMFVPARCACLPIVDDVVCCIGDDQDAMRGLSSFASEILRISHNLQRSRDERLLLLIDEPARTTNPVEGRALVNALATLLDRQKGYTLITTHYSNLGTDCHRLRVRGFDERLAQQTVTADNINQFIDYSLVVDHSDTVPHEALRIAELLGCDSELVSQAKAALE